MNPSKLPLLSANKENATKAAPPGAKRALRVPLRSLDDGNLPAALLPSKLKPAAVKAVRKQRSNSTSALNFLKVTVRDKTPPKLSPIDLATAQFVDAREAFARKVEANKIPQNLPVARELDAKKRKSTLLKKLSVKRKRRSSDFWAPENYDFEKTYMDANISVIVNTEERYVLRMSYLKKYLDANSRSIVIDWLVYCQQVLEFDDNVFFVGVRLFDYFIILSKPNKSSYVLIGIVCLWIAGKFNNVVIPKIPKLCSLCNQRFTKCEILAMEQSILCAVKFDLNFPEPTLFLNFYMMQEGLEHNNVVRFTAMAFMELFAVYLEYSATCSSVLASAALYFSLEKANLPTKAFLDNLKRISEYVFDAFQEDYCFLQVRVCEIVKMKDLCTEIKIKYSAKEKHNVISLFME